MPDPVQYSYNVVKPFAYENTTSPVHGIGQVNGTHFNGRGTLSGASLGGSLGGPYGAAIGAAAGLATDLWQAAFSKHAAKRANEESKKAADVAYARNAAEARAAREWNSEQSQIRRMRMAGLSPGLAYGQMSPSTAQPAHADKQDVTKADTPKMDNESLLHALQILINQQNANTQALSQQSTANLQSSQTDLNLIDKVYRGAEYQANISSVLSSKDLSDAQKIDILRSMASKINLLDSQARNFNSLANVTEQTGVPLANSEIALNTAKTVTEKERPFEIRQTIETQGDLATYYRRQSAILSQQYGIKQNKVDAVATWLDDHGYSRDYLGFALDFCDDMASHVGSDISNQSISTLFSWLDGRSWLNYLGSRQNTRDINVNRSNISENQIQSNERIAAGHDATRLESIDSYFEHAARSHDSEIRKEFNKYRSEYHLLNKANKKRIDELSAFYESKGYDADRIAQELGYLTHQLYLSQTR